MTTPFPGHLRGYFFFASGPLQAEQELPAAAACGVLWRRRGHFRSSTSRPGPFFLSWFTCCGTLIAKSSRCAGCHYAKERPDLWADGRGCEEWLWIFEIIDLIMRAVDVLVISHFPKMRDADELGVSHWKI